MANNVKGSFKCQYVDHPVSKCSLYISVIVCDQDRQDETPY